MDTFWTVCIIMLKIIIIIIRGNVQFCLNTHCVFIIKSCLVVLPVAGALRVLQQLHIIHRDIKPQNLLLSYPVAGGNSSTGGRKDRPFQEATIKLGTLPLCQRGGGWGGGGGCVWLIEHGSISIQAEGKDFPDARISILYYHLYTVNYWPHPQTTPMFSVLNWKHAGGLGTRLVNH